jgi:hypothetical protein
MAIRQYHYNIFADYHQFYLQDEPTPGGLNDLWTREAYERMFAAEPGVVVIGTVRDRAVPVEVEIRDAPSEESLENWDHVVDGGIGIPSGIIVVAGCTEFFPSAARISVRPGNYRLRAFYGGFATVSENRFEGQDHYKVSLWPGEPIEPIVLKARHTGRGR